jgi:hypothetical protein
VLVPRHWDQACDNSGQTPPIQIQELFDTTGITRTLSEVPLKPLPLAPPWPVYEFITRYRAGGAVEMAGTWDATVDTMIAGQLESELLDRVLPLSGSLEPIGYRSRIVFGRPITFDVAGPVVCMPHMVHGRNQRATGLPDGVNTWGGSRYVREGDARTAVVRILLGSDGLVTAVEDVAGSPEALRRAREVVRGLEFEPALRNGIPIEGELVQAFWFRDLGRPSGG